MRHTGIVLGLLLLLSLGLPPGRAETRPLVTYEPVPDYPGLTGRLGRCEQLRILELWGTRQQAGFTHGYLLASEIIDLIDGYVLDENIIGDPATYNTLLAANVQRMFTWSDDDVAELQAMLNGARARLGDDFRSAKLDRPLELRDLMVVNTIADWFGFLCSSLSVWGELSDDGQLRTGRNLDFPNTPIMAKGQLVLFYQADQKNWAGVSWPGLIGVYTGFSADGVTMLMHDSNGRAAIRSNGFVPRSLILRRALVAARPDHFLADVTTVFRRNPVMVGNNIHVSGPGDPPAGVFEYDGSAEGDGVTLRLATDNAEHLRSAIWCTNHMRSRRAPDPGWRFPRLTRKVNHAAKYDDPISRERLFVLMEEVRQEMTLHTVVFEPRQRVMHVRIPVMQEKPVRFQLDQWWRKTETTAGARP